MKITYANICRLVLEQIDRATINGQDIPLSYNGQSDLVRRIPALINEAVLAICSRHRICTNSYTPQNGTPWGGLVRYPLPEDCFSGWGLEALPLHPEDARGHLCMRVTGDAILLPQGEFLVTYWCDPPLLPDDPQEDSVYEIASHVLHAAICYAAARLALSEDETAYAALMQEYKTWVSSIRTHPRGEITQIADVYGGESA